MATYTLFMEHDTDRLKWVCTVVGEDQVEPEDAEEIGTFTDTDTDGKVIYHYVRDLLYAQKVWDMQNVEILLSTDIPPEPVEEE